MIRIFDGCEIEEDLKEIIDSDLRSKAKKRARKSKDYYNAKHDIENYRVFYFNSDGQLIEDTTRSNIKISHAFYTELINQKTSYLLSGFDVYSEEEELDNELKFYFDDNFKSELAEVVENASKIGFSYMYAQLGKDFRTHFKYADGLGIIEVVNPLTEEIDYIVNYYTKRVDEATDKKVFAVEVYDKEQTFYYLIKDGKINADTTKSINPRPNKMWKEIENDNVKVKGGKFGFIPFFRLDNDEDKSSDLRPIKALIDDYDLMSCGLSNNLQDVAEGIYVVKGFQGNDFNELQNNIRVKKMVGVGEQGDLDIKTISIPYEARKAKLELDEKNIYRFGMGFNSSQTGDGNITNVVIKSRYALLDLKCDKMQRRLRSFLQPILDIIFNEINQKYKTNYSPQDIVLDFTRKVMANNLDNAEAEKIEAETRKTEINTLLNAAGQLPEATVIKQICNILGLDLNEVQTQLSEKISTRKSINELSDEILNLESSETQGESSNSA